MDSDFPMFQWSKFPNGDKDEQYVIRTNDFEQLKAAKAKILQEISAEEFINQGSFKGPIEFKTGSQRMVEGTAESRTCSVHNLPLEKKFSQAKNKWYWVHEVNGEKCFGHR